MTHIIDLYYDLLHRRYSHSFYQHFRISDPKPRDIHKAVVRDRLLHHALYRELYPFFDRTFIADSYSCRKNKGTHKALQRFKYFACKVSRNDTQTCWVLKCDIKKFFASINQSILIEILELYIADVEIVNLLKKIIGSFHSGKKDFGLPLGNLTSQLLVNIHMNVFDQYVKHNIKAKYYIRYADDFVFLSHDKGWLESVLQDITEFLENELHLSLHPDKVFIKTLASGVDFLGWVHFSRHRVLRMVTKRRMMKTIQHKEGKEEVVQSYLGMLIHGNGYKIIDTIINKKYQKT